jgi:nicotinamidase-related amidase
MSNPKLEVLTPQNSQIIFIDHQPQMAFGVQSIDRQVLKNNTVGLAKAAATFNIPATITTVETQGFSGYTYPELLDVFPNKEILERTSMNSWDDQEAHDYAMQRMIQAGVVPVTWQQVLLEWQRDWAHKDTYDAVVGIAKEHSGAYGMGIDYAYTMVHKAPQRGTTSHETLAPVPAR